MSNSGTRLSNPFTVKQHNVQNMPMYNEGDKEHKHLEVETVKMDVTSIPVSIRTLLHLLLANVTLIMRQQPIKERRNGFLLRVLASKDAFNADLFGVCYTTHTGHIL